MAFNCIGINKCFPLDPCVDSSNCFNGRWPCNQGNLEFGQDHNDSFGQCESVLATGSIFYFLANILLFAFFVLMIILYKIIPIICCWRFLPCLKKKKPARGGKGAGAGGKGDAAKRKNSVNIPIVEVANVRNSRVAVKAIEGSPPAPMPDLEEMYEHSKLSSVLVSHDTEDGDGVVVETIHSRALFKERAETVELYRTCALLGMLLYLDPISKAKVEKKIASGFAEAYRLVSEGLRAATVPSRGKFCLDRAALLFDEIIKIITADCFQWYEGAENWDLEGKEHKALDVYVLRCTEIVNMDPPQRSCCEFIRRAPPKAAPSFPDMPMFGGAIKSSDSVSAVPPGNAHLSDGNAKSEVVKVTFDETAAASPSKPRRKSRAASMAPSARAADVGQGVSPDEETPAGKKAGLVAMASEMCMKSQKGFDVNLISTRKFTLANSSTNMKGDLAASARLGSSTADAAGAATAAPATPLLARLGRTVSRMQTERAMVNILASSPPAKMPDLDKLFIHAELCADMHEGVQIMNLNVKQNEAERQEAVRIYRITALFCKLLHLDPSAMSSAVADKIGAPLAESQALMTEALKSSTIPTRAVECFNRATTLLTEIVNVLTATDGPFHGFPGAAHWTTDSMEFIALDEYVHDCVMLFEDEPPRTCLQKMWHRTPIFWRRLWQAFGIPDAMRSHPLFYICYLIVWVLFVIRFFVFTCDVGPDILSGNTANLSLQDIGSVSAVQCLQTTGRTYLGVGPQYQAILGKGDPHADIAIPLMYGVMHSLLFIFGSIPVPMARGFWRDVSYWMPFMRKVLPIDDHIFLHKFFGYLALFCLFCGALIWTFVLGIQKCFFGANKAACTGFDPINIKEWFNPFENVVMLRVIVIITWFFGITWMRYQNEPPKYWFFGLCCFRRLPNFFRQHWFEWAYILHVTIALATFILAEAARFPVFYPVMATWFLYIVDSWREVLFMTFRCDVEVAKSIIHLDPQDHNRPTTMTVHFENPWRPTWRGGCIKKRPSQGAGMWVFVKIPLISEIEWHPFSLASADGDDFVQLQIGIRAGVSTGWRKPDNWVLDESSQLAKVTGQSIWVQKECKTWTYKLYELLLNTQGDKKIPCKIRGPYGSSFRLCFNRSVKGALIMGAGTGLSAVESMLRAMLHRKEKGKFVPNHVYVCWQARRVGDLLWLWDSLNQLLIKALNDGTIKKPLAWTPASKTLGFLRITFFISRAEENQLDTLRHLPKAKNDNQQVHEWLTSRNRILQSSISSEATHISKYIRHIRAELNRLEDSRNAKLGISFCGPSAVSKLVSDAATEVGGHIEFSSDATA